MKLTKTAKEILFLCGLFLIISLIGGLFNSSVMYANAGKMPVYYEKYSSFGNIDLDSEHKLFRNPSDIKLFYLGDILKFETKKNIHLYSIGDILLGISPILLLIFTIPKLKKLREETKSKLNFYSERFK
jgi:hypothetical protein